MMSESIEKEKLENIYQVEFKKRKSSFGSSELGQNDENNDKNKMNDTLYKPYEVLVNLYNELDKKFQQSKIENIELKNLLDETKRDLESRSTYQCSDDVSTNKLTDHIYTIGNNASKMQMPTEIGNVYLGDSCEIKNEHTEARYPSPTKLERDLKLLYEQCNSIVTTPTDIPTLASNIITLAAHLLRMEKCSYILEDKLKQNDDIILQLQKEIAEKNNLIEQFKLCGLDTYCKSTKSEASNFDIGKNEPDQIQVLNHNIIMEKIKCGELERKVEILQHNLDNFKVILNSKEMQLTKFKQNEKIKFGELLEEIEMLHHHLNGLKLTLNSKDKELAKFKQNKDMNEVFEHQSKIYYEDFMQERKDRENAQSKLFEIEREKNILIEDINKLKKLLEKCLIDNEVIRDEMNENATNKLITNLKQEIQALKNQLKMTNQQQQTVSQIPQTFTWSCLSCTCINSSSQRLCSACQKPRFPPNNGALNSSGKGEQNMF